MPGILLDRLGLGQSCDPREGGRRRRCVSSRRFAVRSGRARALLALRTFPLMLIPILAFFQCAGCGTGAGPAQRGAGWDALACRSGVPAGRTRGQRVSLGLRCAGHRQAGEKNMPQNPKTKLRTAGSPPACMDTVPVFGLGFHLKCIEHVRLCLTSNLCSLPSAGGPPQSKCASRRVH